MSKHSLSHDGQVGQAMSGPRCGTSYMAGRASGVNPVYVQAMQQPRMRAVSAKQCAGRVSNTSQQLAISIAIHMAYTFMRWASGMGQPGAALMQVEPSFQLGIHNQPMIMYLTGFAVHCLAAASLKSEQSLSCASLQARELAFQVAPAHHCTTQRIPCTTLIKANPQSCSRDIHI